MTTLVGDVFVRHDGFTTGDTAVIDFGVWLSGLFDRLEGDVGAWSPARPHVASVCWTGEQMADLVADSTAPATSGISGVGTPSHRTATDDRRG